MSSQRSPSFPRSSPSGNSIVIMVSPAMSTRTTPMQGICFRIEPQKVAKNQFVFLPSFTNSGGWTPGRNPNSTPSSPLETPPQKPITSIRSTTRAGLLKNNGLSSPLFFLPSLLKRLAVVPRPPPMPSSVPSSLKLPSTAHGSNWAIASHPIAPAAATTNAGSSAAAS